MGFDFSIFVGRFHPLFVHLPIGMIIITLVLELIGKSSKNTLSLMWLFSFASTLFSIFTGWQLSLGSSYPEDSLFWHKWLGVSIAVTSFLLFAITKYTDKRKNIFSSILKLGLIIILSLGGHIGGQLKSYQHIIYPILEQKCAQCHNAKSASGNLDLTTAEKLLEGGDGGEVISAGDAIESELFRRVTLDQSNIKFMPTKGIPMTYNEMELLKWWLNNGADFTEKASASTMSPDVVNGILNLYNVDFSPRPWYEKEQGPAIDSSVMNMFAAKGFKVNDLSSSDNFLEVGLSGDQVSEGLDFSSLDQNIIILDFKNSEIAGENYGKISALKNLIRLQLNGTNTATEDILQIKPLPRLESINLFGTKIDDDALDHLANFPALKRIYTWQTNVTEAGISSLMEKRPDITISNGIN